MKQIFLLIIITMINFHCAENNNTQKINKIYIDTINNLNKNQVYEQYDLPLPIEIFNFLREKDEFRLDILTNIISKNTYITQIQTASYLGIYTADLAYCSLLENGQSVIDYTEISGYLSNELLIKDAYGRQLKQRLENNINNVDSLIIITNEAYLKTCNYLDYNKIDNILPFIIYSSWIESLNIIINSESDNIKIKTIQDEILNTQVDIDNIITYLYDVQVETSAYHFNDELKIIIKDLQELNSLFNTYKIEQSDTNYQLIFDKISKMHSKILCIN